MGIKKQTVAAAALIFLGLVVFGCGGKAPLVDESGAPLTVYLKNNIHYQDRLDRAGKTVSKASYANYTDPGEGHAILPVNTAVTIGDWRRGVTIKRISDGKLIHFEYNQQNMGMDVRSYLDLITSPFPVSMEGLSDKDIEGIKEGKAANGMTKQGVRMALGYPAVHRTPSLDDNVWTYWKNRWDMRIVEFNPDGQVVAVK